MRIFAMSDLHGKTKGIEVPSCDLLLVAGDVLPDGVRKEWTRHNPMLGLDWFRTVWIPWMQAYVNDGWVKNVVLTWGNHDWTQGMGAEFAAVCPPWLTILVDRETTVGGVRIWGSPWSNPFMKWAWMAPSDVLRGVYEKIPEGVDIIMSHQPPKGGASRLPDGELVGSIELGIAIQRVKPKAVVCGHIHCGFGLYVYNDVPVFNVSLVDESYRLIRDPTEIRI